MILADLAESLERVLTDTPVCMAEPMAKHTTFGVGGVADCYVAPTNEADLVSVLQSVSKNGVPLTIIGGGSNVLVRDGGIRGVTVALTNLLKPLESDGVVIHAASGLALSRVSRFAAQNSLTGLEFAVGIPGTIGGATWMNAGAYEGEMSRVVTSVRAVSRAGVVRVYQPHEFDYGYRHSVWQDTGDIITEIELMLAVGESADIRAKMADYTARRQSKQPLEMRSAGSTFKRPTGYYAGTLIEATGLKGLTIGGAMVSTKHAGFIVNTGNATATDILTLIQEVQRRVEMEHGVRLEPEVRVFGEDR